MTTKGAALCVLGQHTSRPQSLHHSQHRGL